MSAGVIPKERLSAYQRWEMASFDTATPRHATEPAESTETSAQRQELAQLREAARADGHGEGYAAGYHAGFNEGQSAGLAEARAQAQRLADMADAFAQALRVADDAMADTLTALALDIAQQALRQTLAVRPEAMLDAVREVMAAERLGDAPRLLVHPDDIALVQIHLQDALLAAGWTVRADPSIARGGCRAQGGSGEIDATLPTRWERVAAALGQISSW